MVDKKRPPVRRSAPQRNVRNLLLFEALTTWVLPTIAVVLLGGATLLDALGAVSEPSAAMVAVVALLVLGTFTVFAPRVREPQPSKIGPAAIVGMAVAWVVVFSIPFALQLFPGPPIATTPLEARTANAEISLGPGRFDLVLDAHLPLSSEQQTRQLRYDLTLTDGAGHSYRYDGELGDRWQTRRLGRRGTAPVHLEHLSTTHAIDNPAGGTLRVGNVTLSGVPNATLAASFYHHRVPAAVWLLLAGIVLALGALAFDLWWDVRRTPNAALLTATATGAVLVFCSSAGGHPGLRQVFGSTIVGGLGGIPTAGIAAWLARRSRWIRAIASRHPG